MHKQPRKLFAQTLFIGVDGFWGGFPLKLSGVEKLTRSSSKGFLNRALFAYKNGHFASSFPPLRYRTFISLEKAILSFKVPLRNPFKPDRVSFCTPKIV